MSIQETMQPIDISPQGSAHYNDELPVVWKRGNNIDHASIDWSRKGKTYKELSESFPYGRNALNEGIQA